VVISDNEKSTISWWQTAGVIANVKADKLQAAAYNGTILVMCGDCDRSSDMFDFVRRQLPNPRIHLKAYNGGPLRLNPEIPIPREFRAHEQLLSGLVKTRGLKKIPTIFLLAHWPCGMASEVHMDIFQVVANAVTTARLIAEKTGWDRKRIVPLLHVDYQIKMRTYFIRAKTPEEVYNLSP
jgi:hypothetical protein